MKTLDSGEKIQTLDCRDKDKLETVEESGQNVEVEEKTGPTGHM